MRVTQKLFPGNFHELSCVKSIKYLTFVTTNFVLYHSFVKNADVGKKTELCQ